MKRSNHLLSLSLATCIGFASFSASAATVAYYRFEEGADGVGSTGPVVPAVDNIVDSAGADDTLRKFGAAGTIVYSNDVFGPSVPSSSASNALSMDFTPNSDVYTDMNGPLRTGVYTNFTLETYVEFDAVGGFQTMVGRDDAGNPGAGPGGQSLFYLSTNGTGFRVETITSTSTNVQVNSTFAPVVGTWYHVAAVGNSASGTLELFVNGLSVGSSAGFTGLFDSPTDTVWTLGRGQFNNNNVDFLDGRLDEVRFSDTALTPDQFLNAVPEPSSVMLLGGLAMLLGFKRSRN